jgi:hypothetical protein
MIFENVTEKAGIVWSGSRGSFSTGWTDFNRDGLPDLWISPHAYWNYGFVDLNHPKLYLNQGNNSFIDIGKQIFSVRPGADTHGSTWTDFDNDGDPDLTVLNGGQRGLGVGPSFLFVNEQGLLSDQAAELGVDFPLGRGRSPLWFDWNRDGLLELLEVNAIRPDGQAPTTLFEQTATGFENVNALAGLPSNLSAELAQLGGDLFDNRTLKFILYSPTTKVYEVGQSSLIDITEKFPNLNNLSDVVFADFDGDLVTDIFGVRQFYTLTPELFQARPNLAFVSFTGSSPSLGASFQGSGEITFDWEPIWNPSLSAVLPPAPAQIFIGAKGVHPEESNFSLSADDPNVVGIVPPSLRNSDGIYLGYDPEQQIWQVFRSISTQQDFTANLILSTSGEISHLTALGFQPVDYSQNGKEPVLLLYDRESGNYVDYTVTAGLDDLLNSQSVVAGDFDNDMDVDLFLSAAAEYYTLPSIYYENQGDGTFVSVQNGAGAFAPPLGPARRDYNTGPNVSVADYNRDGFLDLYLAEKTIWGISQSYLGFAEKVAQEIMRSRLNNCLAKR